MKTKITALMILLALTFAGSAFSQDNKVQDPGIWNQIQRAKWYSDRGLQEPGNIVSNPDPLVYANRVALPRVFNPEFIDPADIRINSTASAQSENSIAVNNTNPLQLMISTNGMIPISPTIVQQTWYFSINGGLTWNGSDNIPPPIVDCEGDPVALFDLSNRAFYFTLGATGSGGTGIYGVSTTDLGTTWSARFNADPNNSTGNDKEHAMTDLSGVFPNNVYCVWTDFNVGVAPLQFTRSTDHGVTWSARQTLGTGVREQGCNMAIGPQGQVYVVVAHYPSQAETGMDFAKSTDGGVTFSAMTTAFPMTGIRVTNAGDPRFNNVRVSSFPHMDVDRSSGSRSGNIYVVCPDQSTGNSEIKMWTSVNQGTSWTGPITISTPLGGQKWAPSIAVDRVNGNIAVSYYNFDSVGFYASRWTAISQDGGATWDRGKNSDYRWLYNQQGTPNTAAGYNGDYYETAFQNNKVVPCWSDRHDAGFPYNKAYVDVITVGPPPAHDYAVGPFMNFPANPLLINTTYNIKTQVSNVGTSAETNVPITFYINGTLTNTTNKSLNAGQIDSVNNVWTPTVAGTYTLKYISNLSTDLNRLNDTIQATVNVLTAIPALCEQYEGSFPPTGWSGGGTYLIGRTGVSGFGIGNGCAEYNSWSAPTTDVENLFTSTFPATGVHDSIVIDLAYASYPAAGITQDSLIITASTNGGTTYVSVARLGPLQLATAPAQSTEFTPTASQWKKVAFVLPSGTNKIDFQGKSQFGNDMFWDSTCIKSGLIGISNNGNNIPRVYSLAQNYPNPFNPTTTISFGLPKAGLVKLVVYDILGRVVSTLVNEHRDAGMYNIAFDATNISSGVYFYKIESGDFSSIKKMVLVK